MSLAVDAASFPINKGAVRKGQVRNSDYRAAMKKREEILRALERSKGHVQLLLREK